MFTIFKQEMKMSVKSLVIWALAVGLMGMMCILLYSSMEESMAGMAESFSKMGSFADAFGMSTLSIATISGFFATEIGTMHSLGGAMFAACIATTILSKEEDGHTGEFLYSLPVSRGKVVITKIMAVLANIIAFNVICGLCYGLGFGILGKGVETKEFFIFLTMQLLLEMEVGGICLVLSAFSKRNKLGAGIGIAMCLYTYDLMARVLPDLKDYIFIGPFSYANASDIFAKSDINVQGLGIGMIVMAVGYVLAYIKYTRKDLAS